VAACTEESQLRSLVSTEAVPLTFVNHSGGDVRLYWLGYDGQLVSYGGIPTSLSKSIMTFVTHPWVVEDSAGHCIRIVRPGPSSREAVIGSADVALLGGAELARAAGVPLSGTWKFDGVIRDGDRILTEIRPICILQQAGTTISGSCKGPANEGSMTGIMAGGRVEVAWHIGAGQAPPVTFTGVLETDGSIDGEMRFPGYSVAPFRASRQ
jgi:hypothetical protein